MNHTLILGECLSIGDNKCPSKGTCNLQTVSAPEDYGLVHETNYVVTISQVCTYELCWSCMTRSTSMQDVIASDMHGRELEEDVAMQVHYYVFIVASANV